MSWSRACPADELEPEDVIEVDVDGQSVAVYRSKSGTYHASEPKCTHARVNLAGGCVIGMEIECPKHNARFDLATGEATRRPAVTPLRIYPVEIRDGWVFVELPPTDE
jgi:3-phenylpropionate/trans-cinnamate dioxygenase ferredoxin subunit